MTVSMRKAVSAFKRRSILDKAAELFYQKGYDGTRIEEVAAALGVTKPYIYRMFDGKQAVLDEICIVMLEHVVSATDITPARGHTSREKLVQTMQNLVEMSITDQKELAIYFREEKYLSTAAGRKVNLLRRHFDVAMRNLILDGQREGVFQSGDAAVTAFGLAGIALWVYNWYRPNGRLSPKEVADEVANIALRIVGADL